MSSLKRDLIERRLWPLAIVIIAAIVAVPFVLRGHRANADIAAPPAATGTSTTSSSPTHKAKAASAPRTTPTSHTRDPFAVAGTKTAATTSATSTTSSSSASPSSSSSSSSSATSTGSTSPSAGAGASSSGTGSGSSSQATTPVATTPATTTSPVTAPVTTSPGTTSHHGASKTRWDVYSVDLRIGAPGSTVAHHDVARLTPLPRERSPQAMYMGVQDHGRAAVFALGAGVEVRSAGGSRSAGASCHPSRVDCSLAVIPAGKSVALVYVSATGRDRAFVLQVSRIKSEITRSEAVVKAARRHVSPLGLCDLKLGDPIGFFDISDDSVSVPSTGACRHRKLAVAFPGSLGAGSSVRG